MSSSKFEPRWHIKAADVMDQITKAGGIKSWSKTPKTELDFDSSLISFWEVQGVLKENDYHLDLSVDLKQKETIIVKSPEYVREVIKSKIRKEFGS